jgi:hypothetical protein
MFALPAAASAVAAAAPAAAAGAASAGIGATLTSIAGNVLMNVAISAAMSIFQPQVGVAGRTFEWTLDPDGPIPFAAGRIGVPGSAVYRKTFGPDLMYYGIPSVISGAGPVDGFEGFMADDETVAFDGSGKAISSQYAGELWYKNKLGTQPDTAITSPTGLKNGATLPGWTSAHRLSGKACYMIVMGENSKGTAFPTGEIKPLITLRGLKVYDPRLDSTYPGGSGSHRLSNPSTWTYSANPILWALKWALGLWEGPNGKGAPQVDYQVGGIGAKLSGIDVPAFVAAANIADINDWTCAAYPTTDDDKHQVLTGFLQAGGAIYAQRAGKISCIQRAAPRTSIVTVSAYDTAGPLEIDTAASRIDRINTLRPRFWSEPHRWQMTALDQEVTAQTYRDEDGGVRPAGIDYPYVTSAVQAAQLAALQIANTREGIAGVIPLKPHLQRIRPGDAFTITEAGFVLNGLKCLCLNTDYDPATGVVRVSFVSETDAKYPFALGQDPTPPTPQVLTPVDPTFVSPPGAGDWTITPRPPAPGGGQLPGFDLGGGVSNDTATAIIVETGPTATGPWTQAYQGPPTVTNIPIDGLQSGATYYVAIQYQRNQNYSERHVYGPYTAPVLDPGPNAPTILQQRADIDALADLQASDTVIVQQQIDSLTARSNQAANLIDNPSGAADPAGSSSIRSWVKEGGPNVQLINDQEVGRIFVVGDYMVSQVYPASPGQKHSLSYNASPVGGGHVRLQYITPSGAVEGVRVDNTLDEKAVRRRSAAPSIAPAGTTGFRLIAAPPSGGVLPVWAIKVNFGEVATDFTDDYSANVLQADVSITKTIVFDLESQNALARLSLVAAASGSVPARIGLISSTLGSAITFDAPYIYWGSNTVFDDATDTLQTTVGSNVRVLAFGAPFGASGNLLEWWGPASIGLGAMTTGNGLNGRMTTAPYVFDNVTGGARQALVSVTDRSVTTSWTLMAQYDMGGVSAGSNGVVVAADFDVGTFLFVPSRSGVTDFYGEMQLRELAQDGSGSAVLGTKAFNSTSGDPSAYVVAQGSRTGAVRYQVWMRSTQPGESATIGGRVQFQAAPNG